MGEKEKGRSVQEGFTWEARSPRDLWYKEGLRSSWGSSQGAKEWTWTCSLALLLTTFYTYNCKWLFSRASHLYMEFDTKTQQSFGKSFINFSACTLFSGGWGREMKKNDGIFLWHVLAVTSINHLCITNLQCNSEIKVDLYEGIPLLSI